MSDVFISYPSADRHTAERLAAELHGRGIASLFLDSNADSGIVAGSSWEDTLYAALQRARVLHALHSLHWRSSRWCFAEVSHAKLLGRTIIPVCLDDTPLHSSLANYQSVKLSNAAD